MAKSSILDSDSRLSTAMGTAWELIRLNLLVLLCSVPLVTIGAAVTAMHYVLLKLVRKEDSYLTRDFFHAFRSDFGQATLLWLIKLAFVIPLGIQLMMLDMGQESGFPRALSYAGLVAGFAVLVLLAFTFPLQSHFRNSLAGTLGNSLRLGLAKFPRAFVLAFIWALPAFFLLHVLAVFPLLLLLGISLPGYICCRLYEPVLKELE
ncbi:MAG: YesL family protein [Blautia sp.]|nr:YesL family protein [Blautia sp.]